MGRIVGSQSYAECDDCRAQSTPHYDQSTAWTIAMSEGFYFFADGHAQCRECSQGLKRVAWISGHRFVLRSERRSDDCMAWIDGHREVWECAEYRSLAFAKLEETIKTHVEYYSQFIEGGTTNGL